MIVNAVFDSILFTFLGASEELPNFMVCFLPIQLGKSKSPGNSQGIWKACYGKKKNTKLTLKQDTFYILA